MRLYFSSWAPLSSPYILWWKLYSNLLPIKWKLGCLSSYSLATRVLFIFEITQLQWRQYCPRGGENWFWGCEENHTLLMWRAWIYAHYRSHICAIKISWGQLRGENAWKVSVEERGVKKAEKHCWRYFVGYFAKRIIFKFGISPIHQLCFLCTILGLPRWCQW